MMKECVQRPTEIEEKPERGTLSRFGRALIIGGVVASAIAGANAVLARRAGTPRHELGGVFARYPWRFGDLAYTVAGKGKTLVLVHGLGAGNSMAEWSEVFPLLREHFTTYAFDFLGWGLSDQPDIEYVADDYVAQLAGFIEDIVGEPCIVVASGDGCDYAIQAAARMPNLISQVVLVCPPLVPEQ
ncbi:MAG TPA: alpha/beta fold hydrolase, partial [Abditibacteriaceae bacterium]|nr:alpha/beta fold hydrolase [Abditibacteriaceae bacterium]